MKKMLCVFISIVIAVSAALFVPVSAQAKTGYWIDMNVAESNIKGLKNYIYIYGDSDSSGDRVISYFYEGSNERESSFYIAYNPNTDVLNFFASFSDVGYVNLYYTYYNMTPEVLFDFTRLGASAHVSFDCTEYDYDDVLSFIIDDSYGNISYNEIQELCNAHLRAAVEGWNNCLIDNTPYTLNNIGFNSLCRHNLSTSYQSATFGKDGKKIRYCYECGYNEETDIASIGEVKLNKSAFTYSGAVNSPAVIVKDSNGNAIPKSNYYIYYQSGRTNPGRYCLTVNFINGIYKGSKTLYFTVLPKPASLKKPLAKKKKIIIKWKKQPKQISGYQIQYSRSKKFKNAKTVTVKSKKKTSVTVKKLKSNKKYYIRIRTYKTVGSSKYYSAWSKTKSVKTE